MMNRSDENNRLISKYHTKHFDPEILSDFMYGKCLESAKKKEAMEKKK